MFHVGCIDEEMDETTLARAKASSSQIAALQTVTRVDLAEAVYRRVGLSRKESAVLVEMVLSEVIDRLAVGETVKLSSFGSFIVRDKGERVGRNPKTGVEVPIMQASRSRVQTLERPQGADERRRHPGRRRLNAPRHPGSRPP